MVGGGAAAGLANSMRPAARRPTLTRERGEDEPVFSTLGMDATAAVSAEEHHRAPRETAGRRASPATPALMRSSNIETAQTKEGDATVRVEKDAESDDGDADVTKKELFTDFVPVPVDFLTCDDDARFASKGMVHLHAMVVEATELLVKERLGSNRFEPNNCRLPVLLHLINTTLECAKNSYGLWTPAAAGFESAIDAFQTEWDEAIRIPTVATTTTAVTVDLDDNSDVAATPQQERSTDGNATIDAKKGRGGGSQKKKKKALNHFRADDDQGATDFRALVDEARRLSDMAGKRKLSAGISLPNLGRIAATIFLLLQIGSLGLIFILARTSVERNSAAGIVINTACAVCAMCVLFLFFFQLRLIAFNTFTTKVAHDSTRSAGDLLYRQPQQPRPTATDFVPASGGVLSLYGRTFANPLMASPGWGGMLPISGNDVPSSQSIQKPLNAVSSGNGGPGGTAALRPAAHDASISVLETQQSLAVFAQASAFSKPTVFDAPDFPAAMALPENFDASRSILSLSIKDYPRAVQLDVRSVTDRVLLIVTDLNGKVIFWDEGAMHMCGFLAEDALGKHISNFIYSESSCELHERMVRAASTKVPMAAKQLSLVHRTYGSVVVRGTVAAACSHDAVIGFSFCASEVESGAQRTQSLLHQFVLDDLTSEIEVASKQLTSRFALQRCSGLLEKFKWATMSSISGTVADWHPATLHSVLEDSLRNRHQFIDVNIHAAVPDVLVCDLLTVGPALSELMAAVSGKSRLNIRCASYRGCFNQVVVEIVMQSLPKGDFATKVSYASDALGAVCGEAVQTANDRIVFTFPFLYDESTINQTGHSLVVANQGGSEPSKPVVCINVILMERSPVFRQNIVQSVFNLGHSLRVSETYEKCGILLDSFAHEVGALLVDIDAGLDEAEELLAKVRQYSHIMIILTSEVPCVNLPADTHFLLKPISRVSLEKLLDIAAAREAARKEEEEKVKKHTEMLRTVRHSPWVRGKKLGKGAFADVYEAEMTMTGGKMAVKMLRTRDLGEGSIESLLNEIEILCRLDHPNIIHYFYCEQGANTINLFMQLADGSLNEYLAKRGGKLSEPELSRVTKQLLLALDYLHQQGIVHRDIKPGNILICGSLFMLTDFGTATFNQVSKDTQGTVYYMAPEVIDGAEYGKACDIWSLGCVLCECLGIQRSPMPGGHLGHCPPTLTQLQNLSQELRGFLLLCFKGDSAERPTAGSLLHHEFIVELQSSLQKSGFNAGDARRRQSLAPTSEQREVMFAMDKRAEASSSSGEDEPSGEGDESKEAASQDSSLASWGLED